MLKVMVLIVFARWSGLCDFTGIGIQCLVDSFCLMCIIIEKLIDSWVHCRLLFN
jgi:hypothetical protein